MFWNAGAEGFAQTYMYIVVSTLKCLLVGQSCIIDGLKYAEIPFRHGVWLYDYTVRITKKVIHIQRPIVLKSINLKIYMWHISKDQLILFPLVHFLHQVCHAWPSTLPLKMTMSWPTFCKFWQLDKSVIAKQCNGVAAEIVSSHARWSFPFW